MKRRAEMTHEIVPETLMAFVDGELPEGERATVEKHLETCGECRQLMSGWKSISTGLNAWNVGALPEKTEKNILAAAKDPWGARSRAGRSP